MQRIQMDLSEAERQGLQALAQSSGRSQTALIRAAIDSFPDLHQPRSRRARLPRGRGLWANRDDLPVWGELLQELNRIAPANG